ncbi:MAG: MarR family winged helix-turn-helix transcriptional regulator [Acidimicrobiales bacterium]
MSTVTSVDSDVRRRVGRAWRKIRRGASAVRVKDLFYATGDDVLDLALADALSVICQQDAMRMGELADALDITPASTTRAVSCLVDRGYVEREKAADDQRSILVSATPAGRARYEVFNGKIQAGLSEILDEFSVEEQEQLANYLERFVRSVDRFVERHELDHKSHS